jgi:translocation and assembly module TamA
VDLRATVPLASLRQIPQIAGSLESLPFELASGPVSVSLNVPDLDTARILPALGMEEREERLRAGVSADLTFEPGAPAAGRGEIRIVGLAVEAPDGRLASNEPLIVRLGDGRLEVLPVHLRVSGGGVQDAGVDLRATADLDRSWNPFEDEPAAAVSRVSAEGGGTIEASLLNPFLEGGAASGELSFAAQAAGPLDALSGEVRLSGPGAAFFWPTPYATRIQGPEVVASLSGGRVTIREGKAVLNGGTVELAGGRAADGVIDLEARLANVPYVFDYGLSALLSGNLAFRMPPEGRSRLSGKVVVERGVLNRDVNLDREVLDVLLQPDDTPGTETGFLDTIDLALTVDTVSGVRIRNNVADLRAFWDPLRVTGTLENPVIRGRIDVDPDGLLYAYGQTLRIDRGSLVFTGDPLNDPRLDFSTTSSFEDPTIGNLRGPSRPLDLLAQREALDEQREQELEEDLTGQERPSDVQGTVTTGLQGYYGARILSQIGLAGLYGEADPSAGLTVGGDLSRNVSFALQIGLRNAEERVYLLDLHDFRGLPSLSVQGFTTDTGSEGGNLQQVLELGGSRPPREEGPRLRRLRLDMPRSPGIFQRLLRRSIGLKRGEVVPPGAGFETEVDVADYLRRRGYPDPRITVAVNPVADRPDRVDVAVKVEPGPRISFEFTGDRPPRASRREIAALYHTDFYEPAAVGEMKKTAVQAFRVRGHLEPEVEVEVKRERPEDPDGPRTVVVRSQAGPRVEIRELVVPRLSPEEMRWVAGRFPGTLSRVELAAGEPGADRRLLDALRSLGWPEARIVGHAIGSRGARLTVRVDLGERQTLGDVEIAGVEGEELDHLRSLLDLQPGDPARLDRVSAAALVLEDDLRSRGYADATVRSSVSPEPGREGAVGALFEVTPGPYYEIAGVAFEGDRASRGSLLSRVADLSPGEPLNPAVLDEARGRLFDLGVFSRVTADVDKSENGEAQVTFSLAEKPRYRVGYGLRTVSGEGISAVVDAADRNFLGRAIAFGVRGLYEKDDQSGRLLLSTGGLLGTPISFETYAQGRRRRLDEGEALVFIEDSREVALQLASPLGSRATGRLYARYRTTHLYEEEPDPFFPFDLEIILPYVGTQLLFDSRNDPVDATSGLFASFDLSGSGAFLGSDFDYIRSFGQLNLFRGLGLAGRRLTWAQSFRLGLGKPFRDQDLISDERFYAGGEFSVRGYETESLGPSRFLDDRALGGEALLVINEELRFALPFDLTGLFFFDAGQVWPDPGDFGTDLAKSLGLGLRARTPLGLVRFDAAFPLDRRPQDDSYKLYLGFGNAF